jgi:hypothetical protein
LVNASDFWIGILQRTPRQRKDRNPEWRMKIWGCRHIEPEHDPKQEIEQRAIDFIFAGQAYF